MEKESSLLNKSADGSMLDEGGREENESEDEFVDLLEEEEDFEDVEEDEDDVEELDTSGVLEEVEREDILEEKQVPKTSQNPSSLEKEKQGGVERPIMIQGEGEELLQEVGGDHLETSWLSCPLCSASFLKVVPIDRFIHNILLTPPTSHTAHNLLKLSSSQRWS